MSLLGGVLGLKAIQGFTDVVAGSSDDKDTKKTAETTEKSKEGTSFAAELGKLLSPDPANNVNEEDLFAALATKQISDLKGEEAGAKFQEVLGQCKEAKTREDGYIFVEDATNMAIDEMAASGEITEEEAATIRNQAFGAAQLDGNTEALFDGRGSGEDPTIATMNIDEAMAQATDMLEKYASGELTAPDVSSFATAALGAKAAGGTVTPEGTNVDGEGGFLWKPESEKSGDLVVLLPSEISKLATAVTLKNQAGEVLEEGAFSSFANPDAGGDRAHYRFGSPGGEYGSDIVVEVALNNGDVRQYVIPNGSERYD